MSVKGIRLAASVFSLMQSARIELIQMGTKNKDKQDILLGQMLDDGHCGMKEKFCKLTVGVIGEANIPIEGRQRDGKKRASKGR